MNLNDILLKRCSVRSYTQAPVSKDTIAEILYAGMAAPVSHKLYKDIQFTVIQDEVALKKINSYFANQPSPFYHAPALIILSTKTNTPENIYAFNLACIVENMLLKATELNLGSIFLTKFLEDLKDNPDFRKDFSIEKESVPIAAVAIGTPVNSLCNNNWNEIVKRILVNWY